MLYRICLMGSFDAGKTTLLSALMAPEADEASALYDRLFIEAEEESTLELTRVRYKLNPSVQFLDVPGQTARSSNLFSGFSLASQILLVIDAERGITHDLNRQLELLKIFRPPLLVVINKIDCIDLSGYTDLVQQLKLELGYAFDQAPAVAVKPESLKIPSLYLQGYTGPSLFECLSKKISRPDLPLRISVSGVADGLVLASLISGSFKDGQMFFCSGQKNGHSIKVYNWPNNSAGDLFLTLKDDGLYKKGQLLYSEKEPQYSSILEARIFWIQAIEPLNLVLRLLDQTITLNHLQIMSDRVRMQLDQPLMFDRYLWNWSTSLFVLEHEGEVVAFGRVNDEFII